MIGTFLACLAAVLVYELIERAMSAGDDAKQAHWDRKYRGRR